MPEPPQRLLEAVALALAEDVAPHLHDRFAQMQCKAAAELLGNLAAELDWADGPLRERNRHLAQMLAALQRSGWEPWRTRAAPAPDADAATTRAALLDELEDALRWVAGKGSAAAAGVDALLRADLERQTAALRRGMFR